MRYILALILLLGFIAPAMAISPEQAQYGIFQMMMGDRVVGTGFHIGNNYLLTNQHICDSGWKKKYVKDPETGNMTQESASFDMTARHRMGYRYELEAVKEGESGGFGVDLCLVKMTVHDTIFIPDLYREQGLAKPPIATEVWSMGMPNGDQWIYTYGRMSHPDYAGGQRHVLVMPGTGGQSGSPVFDSHGRLICVVSEVMISRTGPMSAAPVGYTLCVPLRSIWAFMRG